MRRLLLLFAIATVGLTGCSRHDVCSGLTAIGLASGNCGPEPVVFGKSPEAPMLSSLAFGDAVAATLTAGEQMVALFGSSGFGVIDLSNPKLPAISATIPTAGKVLSLEFDVGRAAGFYVDATGVLGAIDFSVPSAPIILGNLTLPNAAAVSGLLRVGDQLFVMLGTQILPVAIGAIAGGVNVTLTPGTMITLPSPPKVFAGGGGQIYLGDGQGLLSAWATIAGTMVKLGEFALRGAPSGLVVRGSRAFVIGPEFGLCIVDFSGTPVSIYDDKNFKDATSLQVFGSTLVVTLSRGLIMVLDISNPAQPRAVAQVSASASWLSVLNGLLAFGSGSGGQVASIPPFPVSGIPAAIAGSFPRASQLAISFNTPLDSSTVSASSVTLSCNKSAVSGAAALALGGFTIFFHPDAPLPATTDCVLSLSDAIKDLLGNAIVASKDGFKFKTDASTPGPVMNPRSAYPHTVDGHFSSWTTGATTFEWFDVKPAKGMYTFFYADYDGTNLYMLNDWFYNGDRIEPDCYNQFNAWTADGAEQWEVRAYGDQHVEVRLNGKRVKPGAEGVQGGASFGASPNVLTPHTQYEIAVAAKPGGWGVQLHDPGPAFVCHQLEHEPTPMSGTLTMGGSSTVDTTLGVGILSGLFPFFASVGQAVTISGIGFGAQQGGSTVQFGAVPGVPTSWSDTQIVVPVPAGVLAGTASVTVSRGGMSSNAMVVTIEPGPALVVSGNFAAGANPFAVVAGDFNGDGKPDVAVANSGGTDVSVLLGTGDGKLAPQKKFGAGTAPVALAAADLDGDGKLDLAVANHGSNDVSILAGKGDGTFGAAVSFAAGTNPRGVVVGDFNGDGKPDLAVANQTSGDVSILVNLGGGRFGAPAAAGAGTWPRAIVAGDFNGDGKLDLAVANYLSGDVSVLAGRGDGSFGAARSFAAGALPFSIAVGDFNGDSKLDLAVATSGVKTIALLAGNGDGTFKPPATTGVPNGANAVVAVDFDKDGKLDLGYAENGASTVGGLLGKGDLTFQSPSQAELSGRFPQGLFSIDLNLDGKPDLITANYSSNDITLLLTQ